METRFFGPVVIATAFHALVLLGFNGKHAPAPIPVKEKETAAPPIEINLDPREPEETSAPDTPPMAKGKPDPRPRIAEPISSVIDFEIPTERNNAVPRDIVTKLEPGPIGDPFAQGEIGGGKPVLAASFLDNPPQTRARVAPTYPSAERAAGVEGEVLVEFIVDESGRVTQPVVIRSSRAAFESPTLRAVEKWRFEPGKKDGRAVRFRMQIPVRFSLST